MRFGHSKGLEIVKHTRRALPVRLRAALGALALVCLAVLEYSLT